eukprot:scaffold3346_cov313-Pinguiococcus_pyrenoidosus.AAC.9
MGEKRRTHAPRSALLPRGSKGCQRSSQACNDRVGEAGSLPPSRCSARAPPCERTTTWANLRLSSAERRPLRRQRLAVTREARGAPESFNVEERNGRVARTRSPGNWKLA